jgi:hypothetical protein
MLSCLRQFFLLLLLGGAMADARALAHWAYEPLTNPEPPKTCDPAWPHTGLDLFVLKDIEEAGLVPAPDAARATVLRRLYFDLTGLPPTPQEIEDYLADPSPVAFRRTVDRLLGSPQFGERWGRHWLDIARYAESVTLRGLVFKEAWRYRDYVIDAFNRDLPFDQFVREQIAGDLLDSASLEERQRRRIATTYLVLGNHNYEEQDKEQLRMDIVDEQLDTIGKGLLGQTISCARCHDHKFDPIPTRDYYAMAGILRNTKSVEHANVSAWLEVPLPVPPEVEAQLKAREERIATLQREIKVKNEALSALNGDRSGQSTIPSKIPGIVIDDAQATLIGEWKSSQHNTPFVGVGYVHDDNSGKGNKTATFLPGLDSAGNYEVRLAYTAGGNRASNVPVTVLHAAGETTVYVNQKNPPPLLRHFVSLGEFAFEAGNQGYVLVSTEGTDGHVIADAVQFVPSGVVETSPLASGAPDEAAEKLKAKLQSLRAELKEVSESGLKRPVVMSVQEEGAVGDLRVHHRGSVHQLGAEIPRGFLQAVAVRAIEIPANESGRRQLADWIVSPENPLTPRVFVNRVWVWLFGTGLVRTPDNFGTTGATPSHPELLDYLASRFVREGWSVKKLVREIVLSRTYQLSSEALSARVEQDPENRLFARANRRPADAEFLRDAMLACGGNLRLECGGPTIQPGTAADYGYVDGAQRRSIYVPAFRNALPQIFELFDFADTSVVTGQRSSAVVAPQALFLLNNPFVLEQSESAARRLLGGVRAEERMRRAWLVTLGREPNPEEARAAARHLELAALEEVDEKEAWAELFQGLFGSVDFRYID